MHQVGSTLPRSQPLRPPKNIDMHTASVTRGPMHRQSQSEYDTRSIRVVVNNSKNKRLQPYQTTEKEYNNYAQARALEDQYIAERKREKRASKIIQERRPVPDSFRDDDEVKEEAQVLRPTLRTRRQTDASDIRKGKERPIIMKVDAAEEYIKSTRNSCDPFANQINKAAKRASRMPSVLSDSGSSQSNGSRNRTTMMTSNTNNEIRVRLQNSSVPVNLQITGNIEGRTLQLVPAKGGATDLVIGNGNTRGETSYHSERGSVMANNRRSIVAGQGRRDAEEARQQSRSKTHRGTPTKDSQRPTQSLARGSESEYGDNRSSKKKFRYTVSQDDTAEKTQRCKSRFIALRQGHRSAFRFEGDNTLNPLISEGILAGDKRKRRDYYDDATMNPLPLSAPPYFNTGDFEDTQPSPLSASPRVNASDFEDIYPVHRTLAAAASPAILSNGSSDRSLKRKVESHRSHGEAKQPKLSLSTTLAQKHAFRPPPSHAGASSRDRLNR